MKNRQDRKLILLVIITVILNIAVLCFVLAPSEKKNYSYSDAMLRLISDIALFDYWDDWKVGETVEPSNEDVETLLGILDCQKWDGVYAAEDLSLGIIEDGGREDTARLMIVRHLEEGEELFGQTGDVLISYRINLWSGTVTVGNLSSSITTSARRCMLSDKDVLKIKEILYRNFGGVSEIISLNPNRPNFTFQQSSGDALSRYSISLYTWDNRFSRSAVNVSMSLGGTYEYIRDKAGTRLILKYPDGVYEQFWVEKDKLIYDRKNSRGESPYAAGAEFVYADVHTDLSGYYGSAAADLNKNGVMETVYLGIGFTSGVFSFNIYVKENGEQIYAGMVTSPYGEPAFAVKDGSLCLRFEVEGGVKDFTISLEKNTMILTGDDGEVWSVSSRIYK